MLHSCLAHVTNFTTVNFYTDIVDCYFKQYRCGYKFQYTKSRKVEVTSFNFAGVTNSTANNYGLFSQPNSSYVWYVDNSGGPNNGEIRFVFKGEPSEGVPSAVNPKSFIAVSWRIIRNSNFNLRQSQVMRYLMFGMNLLSHMQLTNQQDTTKGTTKTKLLLTPL